MVLNSGGKGAQSGINLHLAIRICSGRYSVYAMLYGSVWSQNSSKCGAWHHAVPYNVELLSVTAPDSCVASEDHRLMLLCTTMYPV